MDWQDEIAGTPDVPAVKSAARVLDLLDDIAVNGPATRAQLSLRMGIPKSSIHAVLRTMISREWLELDHAGGAYRLGFRSLVVSSAFLECDPMMKRVAPLLNELAAATGETVHLGRLDGADVVYLDKRECAQPVPMVSVVGRRVPAYCTALGRSVLATRSRAGRAELVPDGIVPITAYTMTDKDAVLAAIEHAARLGYAVESEEVCLGVRCFGVALPVVGTAVNALSVAVPVSRLDAAREHFIIETLLRIAARYPEGCGYRTAR